MITNEMKLNKDLEILIVYFNTNYLYCLIIQNKKH